jgi:hypothetical protein
MIVLKWICLFVMLLGTIASLVEVVRSNKAEKRIGYLISFFLNVMIAVYIFLS